MSAWCEKCGHLASEGDYLLGVGEKVCWSCQAEQYKAERDALLEALTSLVQQIEKFAEEHGEASFYTGKAKKAIDAARGGSET